MNKESEDSTSLENNGIYLLMDDIEQYTCKDAIEFILEKNIDKSWNRSSKHLTLFVSSYGGCLGSAFALVDIMKGSNIPIHTVGVGMIGSAGLVIFMAGAKGHRILTPNTSILSHQYSSMGVGKMHELLSMNKEHDLTEKRLIRHYVENTNLDEKKIKKLLLPPSDVWLDSEEALKYGICDEVKLTY